VSASYDRTEGGLEAWKFQIPREPDPTRPYMAKRYEFYVSYRVNGVTFYDNNFEYDYGNYCQGYLLEPSMVVDRLLFNPCE